MEGLLAADSVRTGSDSVSESIWACTGTVISVDSLNVESFCVESFNVESLNVEIKRRKSKYRKSVNNEYLNIESQLL